MTTFRAALRSRRTRVVRQLAMISPERFSRGFWTFFAAAFYFDLGLGLFLFLFNLYLTDLHFNEAFIGKITASLTLGNVVGTLPATMLARRYGIRPLLLFSFICAPLVCMFRVFVLGQPAQILLAFLTGVALCSWPICFSPAVASLTDEQNRTRGFSIVFATGIGMGTLSGLLGGYIPALLHTSRLHVPLLGGIRIVLLLACGIFLMGVWPLSKLTLAHRLSPPGRRLRVFHPFLFRFLPPFMLWNIVTGSFPAFGAIYLQQVMKLPLGKLGMVYSASQLAQFTAVLSAPILFRRGGLARGVAIAQIATAALLVLIGSTSFLYIAIAFYVAYNAAQFMCNPGIYNLLMNRIPPEERSTASALQNLSGALCQAGTAAVTGSCIVIFGYHPVLLANSAFALLAAIFFLALPSAANPDERSSDSASSEIVKPAAQCSPS